MRIGCFARQKCDLSEHRELRQTLSLQNVPDHTTLFRFMKRLDVDIIQRTLEKVMREILGHHSSWKGVFAVDATGLALGAISTFFVNRKRDHGQGLPWRYWLK